MFRIKMETDEVRAMAARLRGSADAMDGHVAGISSILTSANWQSNARDEFINNYQAFNQSSQTMTEAMRLMARSAERKADQWEAIANKFMGPFYTLENIWDQFKDTLGSAWQKINGLLKGINWPTVGSVISGAIGAIGLPFIKLVPPWKWEKPSWWPGENSTPVENQPIDNQPVDITPPEADKLSIGLDQDDPLWGNQTMGAPGHTIDNKGCLITSIAMIARSKGVDVNPADVNSYMLEHGGYVKGTSDMYWGSAEKYLESVTGQDVVYQGVSSSSVTSTLSAGNPVVIHVKGSTSDGHWVLATGLDSNGNYIVYESGTGAQSTYSSDQLLSGHKAFMF